MVDLSVQVQEAQGKFFKFSNITATFPLVHRDSFLCPATQSTTNVIYKFLTH